MAILPVAPVDDENTLRSCAGSTPARAAASDATASASFTTRPVRRRSVGGSSAGGGNTVGARLIRRVRRDSTAAAARPAVKPRPEHADAGDVRRDLHPARPKIKLQFVPPKPNELREHAR